MRRVYASLTAMIASAIVAVMAFPPSSFLVWNRTESAPKGLYWRSDGPLTKNGWAIVSGKAPAARWIADHGYLQREWSIIKRVRGMEGDEICRHGGDVFVNETRVAMALETDSAGQVLPVWSGCFVLTEREVFLINEHPHSLDGRYFGQTEMHDVTGAARLVFKVE